MPIGAGWGEVAVDYLFSLRNAWWLYWMTDDAIKDLLVKVFLEQWTGKLQRIMEERGMTGPQFDHAMLWREYTLRRLVQGAFSKDGGLPAMYVYTMASQLGVTHDDLLPNHRELFVEATYRFCRDLVSLVEIAKPKCQAYVEYHLQGPGFRPGVLDAAAAERAFQALPDVFADRERLADAIKQTARAIDRYLRTIN
jgi:hypothetical protein